MLSIGAIALIAGFLDHLDKLGNNTYLIFGIAESDPISLDTELA